MIIAWEEIGRKHDNLDRLLVTLSMCRKTTVYIIIVIVSVEPVAKAKANKSHS